VYGVALAVSANDTAQSTIIFLTPAARKNHRKGVLDSLTDI